MNHIDAMKLALEALEYVSTQDNDRDFLLVSELELLDNAITALREARAEQPAQQEPVAFPTRRSVEREIERTANPTGMHLNDGKERVTLPGGTLRHMLALIDRTSPPAQRKPLTDKEIWQLVDGTNGSVTAFARAIEAKLKEKNNA